MEHKLQNPNKPVNSAVFYEETACSLFIRDGEWYVAGEVTLEKAQALLDAHNPQTPVEPTVAEKLASVGLSVNDLKVALGL
jgi:hypothetical protein